MSHSTAKVDNNRQRFIKSLPGTVVDNADPEQFAALQKVFGRASSATVERYSHGWKLDHHGGATWRVDADKLLQELDKLEQAGVAVVWIGHDKGETMLLFKQVPSLVQDVLQIRMPGMLGDAGGLLLFVPCDEKHTVGDDAGGVLVVRCDKQLAHEGEHRAWYRYGKQRDFGYTEWQ